MRFTPFAIFLFGFQALVYATSVFPESVPCNSPVVVSEAYIGENKDVKVETTICNDPVVSRELAKRQSSNICGATCKSELKYSPLMTDRYQWIYLSARRHQLFLTIRWGTEPL